MKDGIIGMRSWHSVRDVLLDFGFGHEFIQYWYTESGSIQSEPPIRFIHQEVPKACVIRPVPLLIALKAYVIFMSGPDRYLPNGHLRPVDAV